MPLLTKTQIDNIKAGRAKLASFKIAHDNLYLNSDKTGIPEAHKPLMDSLESDLNQLGFTRSELFHAYNAILALVEAGDDAGAQALLQDYLTILNG